WSRRCPGRPVACHSRSAARWGNQWRHPARERWLPVAHSCDVSEHGPARQAVTYHAGNLLAKHGQIKAINSLTGKRVGQQVASMDLVQPTGTQVKHGVFVNLANGGAMRAADIVSVDFELGLGISTCHARQQQAVGTLHGIGTISTGRYQNAAAKYATTHV